MYLMFSSLMVRLVVSLSLLARLGNRLRRLARSRPGPLAAALLAELQHHSVTTGRTQ